MTQNFSNNSDNRPSIKSNDPFIQNAGPFIQNTPQNSIQMENVREFIGPYGNKTYMYQNNGNTYFLESSEIDPNFANFESKIGDSALFLASLTPWGRGIAGGTTLLTGSIIKDVAKSKNLMDIPFDIAGNILGKKFKNPVTVRRLG